MKATFIALLALVIAVGCGKKAAPGEAANKLFVEAAKQMAEAVSKDDKGNIDGAIAAYEQVVVDVRKIVNEYPESDIAVKLVSGETLFTGKSLEEIEERVNKLKLRRAEEQRRAEEKRRAEERHRVNRDRAIWAEYINSHSIKPVDIDAIVRRLAGKNNIDNFKTHSSLAKKQFNTFETIATTIDCKLSLLEAVGIMRDLLDSPKMVRVSNFTIRPSENRKELSFKATVICSNVRHGILKTDPVLIKEGSILIREYNGLRNIPLECLRTVSVLMPEGLSLDVLEYNDSKKSDQNLLLIGSGIGDMGKQVDSYKNALANTEKLDANGDSLKLFTIVREVPFAGAPKKRWRFNCILNRK